MQNPNSHNRLVVKNMNLFTLIPFVIVLILFASIACSKPSVSSENIAVKINRIFTKGVKTPAEPDEFVQIYNSGEVPVDLTDWTIVNGTEGQPSFKFPQFILEPTQTIRVYTNEIHTEWGGFSFGYDQPIWNNTEPDTAVLYNAQGQEVSRKRY